MSLKKYSKSNAGRKNLNFVDTVIVQGGGGGINPADYVQASGGVTTYFGCYTVHTFTTSGTFQVTNVGAANNTVELLVVGGGGSGGVNASSSGGGGGGQVKYYGPYAPAYYAATGSAPVVSVGNYTVTVGAGGTVAATTGVASSIVGTGINVSSSPGNRAATTVGGSSGAGVVGGSSATAPTSQTMSGGGGGSLTGGGGIGGGGFNATAQGAWGGLASGYRSGVGGQGVTLAISGTPTMYGEGGGGGTTYTTGPFWNPFGGGGIGGKSTTAGGAGAANQGGGGGGGRNSTTLPAGSGGSGVVIIRYRNS